jgi:hypothetical protein
VAAAIPDRDRTRHGTRRRGLRRRPSPWARWGFRRRTRGGSPCRPST